MRRVWRSSSQAQAWFSFRGPRSCPSRRSGSPCCPGAALLSLAIALCNLLPVYPLDGGRALRAVCGRYLPLDAVDAVDAAASVCVLAALGLCAVRLVRGFGLLPVWAWALLLTHAAAERNLLLPRRASSDIM